MVSRRDIRCGGQVCRCSSARWHANKVSGREGQGSKRTASRSWDAVRVFPRNRDNSNVVRSSLRICGQVNYSRVFCCFGQSFDQELGRSGFREKSNSRTLEHHEDAAPKTVLTVNLSATRPLRIFIALRVRHPPGINFEMTPFQMLGVICAR